MGIGHVTRTERSSNRAASLRPGNSPGTISVDGGLTLDGYYDWDLNGNDNTLAGGTFDKVNSNGDGDAQCDRPHQHQTRQRRQFHKLVLVHRSNWPAFLPRPAGSPTTPFPQIDSEHEQLPDAITRAEHSLWPSNRIRYCHLESSAARQSTWTGTTSGNWNDPSNWSPRRCSGEQCQRPTRVRRPRPIRR